MWDMVGVASKATAYKQSTKAPEHRKKERERAKTAHIRTDTDDDPMYSCMKQYNISFLFSILFTHMEASC